MNCHYCTGACIKKGKRNGVQKHFCKSCRKHQQDQYTYKRYSDADEERIKKLSVFSMGISSISGYTGYSKSSVQRKLLKLSQKLEPIPVSEENQKYEMDEMSLSIAGMKDIYLIYAINRLTKRVIKWVIGPRTKNNLKVVADAVLMHNPAKIYTDGLNSYPGLIPKAIHHAGKFFTFHIERRNLTLKTHIKRLGRNTLCFSRSIAMLDACLKIYFWS